MNYYLSWGTRTSSINNNKRQIFPRARKEEALAEYVNKATSCEHDWVELRLVGPGNHSSVIGRYDKPENFNLDKKVKMKLTGKGDINKLICGKGGETVQVIEVNPFVRCYENRPKVKRYEMF